MNNLSWSRSDQKQVVFDVLVSYANDGNEFEFVSAWTKKREKRVEKGRSMTIWTRKKENIFWRRSVSGVWTKLANLQWPQAENNKQTSNTSERRRKRKQTQWNLWDAFFGARELTEKWPEPSFRAEENRGSDTGEQKNVSSRLRGKNSFRCNLEVYRR